MNYRITILIYVVLICNISAFSQNNKNLQFFTARDFNKPFVSEISGTQNNISLGKTASNKFSGKDTKELVINEIHMGFDLPLLYAGNETSQWAISFPVSIHMIWAPFDKLTSPIINNDYRFGLSFTGTSNLNNLYIKNLSFKVTPFAHESTHLGDELTISGFQEDSKFYRVNVSYEYYELGITVNDPEITEGNVLSCRAGFMGLLNPDKGYYSIFENEIGDTIFYQSKRWGEFYFACNYKKTDGILTTKRWKPNTSLELRNRIKYDFGKEEKEERQWCLNAYAGFNYLPEKNTSLASVGHYLRYYRGINPHGQLRNGTATFIGYSVVLFM